MEKEPKNVHFEEKRSTRKLDTEAKPCSKTDKEINERLEL